LEEILRRGREMLAAQPGLGRDEVRATLEHEFRIGVEEALGVLFPPPTVVLMDLDRPTEAAPPLHSPSAHARPQPAGATPRRRPVLAH
jgi:hypothetical protein